MKQLDSTPVKPTYIYILFLSRLIFSTICYDIERLVFTFCGFAMRTKYNAPFLLPCSFPISIRGSELGLFRFQNSKYIQQYYGVCVCVCILKT